ncbi:MAG: CcmD family protein [Candidatus Latescibacteria bacterium]|nr:CcmD family protein [Candidatus Latescibacterota bacterium]
MDNLSYLGVAFTAFWVVLFAFFLRLQSREKSLRQEIEALQQQVEKEAGSSAP